MEGICACGCGLPTNKHLRDWPKWGHVKGQFARFRIGHGRATMPVGSTVPPNPEGKCMCGCGRTTLLATYTSHQTGNVKGEHKRFALGHGGSYCHQVEPHNPGGLCLCGCGQLTRISPLSRIDRGYAAGQPENYIHNHHTKKVDYVEEDRGWKTPCWIWQKSLDKNGYGSHSFRRIARRAHRYYYERTHGPIPKGLEVDHLCHVTSCVNPDHLEAVLPIVNQRRKRTTKLDEVKVAMIRQRFANGENLQKLADEFAVSKTCAYAAIKNYTWKVTAKT